MALYRLRFSCFWKRFQNLENQSIAPPNCCCKKHFTVKTFVENLFFFNKLLRLNWQFSELCKQNFTFYTLHLKNLFEIERHINYTFTQRAPMWTEILRLAKLWKWYLLRNMGIGLLWFHINLVYEPTTSLQNFIYGLNEVWFVFHRRFIMINAVWKKTP